MLMTGGPPCSQPVFAQTGEARQLVLTREDDRTASSSIYAATKFMQEDSPALGVQSQPIFLRYPSISGTSEGLFSSQNTAPGAETSTA